MKRNLIVRQEGNKDCGAASLLSVIRYYGGDISLDRLIEMTKTTKEGTNFYNISRAALELGLVSKAYKVDDALKIKKIDTPFIVQFKNKNYTHFVVVYKVNDNKVVVMDPAVGKYNLDMFDFTNSWTGYIMIFEKVSMIPNCSEEKVFNKIIIKTIVNNKNIIFFLLILSLIFIILSCISNLYSQIVFDEIIDTNFNNLIVITILFFILFIIKNITNFIRNHLLIYLNQKLDIGVILSTFSKVILLPYSYYKNKTTSEVLSRINDLSYLKSFISKIIICIFLDMLIFISTFIILYNINYKILFIFLVIFVLYLLVILFFNNIIKRNTILNQENVALVNNTILESISSFETVKGLNIEDNIIYKFSKVYSKTLNSLFYSEKVNNIILFIKELINDIGLLVVNFMSFRFIMSGALSIGDYMTIIFLSGYMIYPIRNVIDILNEFHYSKNAIKRANNLFEANEEKIYNDVKLDVSGNIKIKNLSYSFNNKFYVLRDINLFIKDRERVLLLGASGSGKSTILKLLYKYFEVDRDKIFINNYDINDYSMSDIRKNITYISQNEILYTGSIRDNIILDRNIGEVDYLNICKLLHIDEIVKDNILGYDYLLEENGINISGGQRQRIILARSLLKESKVIMIDEGLNQVDIKLEREILKNIFNYFYDKTFIIVSHRKENIDLYDKVIKIDDGVVEKMEMGLLV
ncbi:MAG: peptidase domain-containing ABC transporter [Bacilli bacterium]|nr:peptidase domain-containing ABC transporter [Bacilli bacterium]